MTTFRNLIENIRENMTIDFSTRAVIVDHANNESRRISNVNGLMVAIDNHMRGCLFDSLKRELETENRFWWIQYNAGRIADHAAAYAYLRDMEKHG